MTKDKVVTEDPPPQTSNESKRRINKNLNDEIINDEDAKNDRDDIGNGDIIDTQGKYGGDINENSMTSDHR